MEHYVPPFSITNPMLFRVAEIAEKVGFEDNIQYFSQVFKKHVSLSPRAYASQKSS